MAESTTSPPTSQAGQKEPQEHNTYLPGYKPSHIQHHAWRTAENSAAYLLPTLQRLAAAKPNLSLLDCGAGPGTISVSFARYLPQGHVTSTDLSADVVAQAQAHAISQGAKNVTCQTASVYELPFTDGTFDVVHAHQMLCHLDSPGQALREMLRVCRPGGIVAVRECDMRMWCFYPELSGLLAAHRLIMQTMAASGGSNTMGVRLVALAMEVGVKRSQIQASMGAWCHATREEREVWAGAMAERLRRGHYRKVAQENGFANDAEMDEMADAWDEFARTEHACFGSMHGEILITK